MSMAHSSVVNKSNSPPSFLPLSFLNVGAKRMRYVYFLAPSSAYLEWPETDTAVPLFLASDVLSGSSVGTENQPRVHARFAKKGLATKLTFQEGIKLYGIHGIGKGVWFYSVQGVMRVAFEILGKEEQLACLTQLQKLWKARFCDTPLQDLYKVHLGSSIGRHLLHRSGKTTEDQVLNSESWESMSETNNSESSNSNLHSMIIPSSSESSCSPSILNQVNKQVASPQFTKLVDPLTASRKQVRDDVPNTTASIDTLSRKQVRDHDVPNTTASICTLNVHHPRVNPDCVASFSQIPVSKTVLSTVTTVTELLESVHKIILHIPKDQTDCYRVGQIIILVLQILNLECKTIGTDSSNHSYFPWILLKEYHQGVQLLQKNLDQTNAAEFMQELSLNITSSWLGKEFHKMSNSISDKVDKFKSEHITSIDNLPPSEQVIDALFPRCMKILFSSWIGIKENERQQQTEHQESSASDDSQAGTDSLKVPQHQPPKQKFSRYPLVQLILEFANQTLISGVAHVLYSRLIHQ